ncbi:MAG: hypothetical protein LC772_01830 [Chloroflexi bacterium]|nr:hypothetical protein [Chloroflexota bacterium]
MMSDRYPPSTTRVASGPLARTGSTWAQGYRIWISNFKTLTILGLVCMIPSVLLLALVEPSFRLPDLALRIWVPPALLLCGVFLLYAGGLQFFAGVSDVAAAARRGARLTPGVVLRVNPVVRRYLCATLAPMAVGSLVFVQIAAMLTQRRLDHMTPIHRGLARHLVTGLSDIALAAGAGVVFLFALAVFAAAAPMVALEGRRPLSALKRTAGLLVSKGSESLLLFLTLLIAYLAVEWTAGFIASAVGVLAMLSFHGLSTSAPGGFMQFMLGAVFVTLILLNAVFFPLFPIVYDTFVRSVCERGDCEGSSAGEPRDDDWELAPRSPASL